MANQSSLTPLIFDFIMKRIISLLVLMMGLIGMLMGCEEKFQLKNFPSQLTLETYKKTGELVSQRIIDADDPIYQRLKLLLEADRSGWKKSIASYKTGHYIFRAENLIIRCYVDAIVIDLMEEGSSTSMKKSIPNLLQALGLPVKSMGAD